MISFLAAPMNPNECWQLQSFLFFLFRSMSNTFFFDPANLQQGFRFMTLSWRFISMLGVPRNNKPMQHSHGYDTK